jgi:hypothetical protein
MRDVSEILVPWAIITLVLLTLVGWDEKRLDDEQLARAWPPSTRTLALVYFGMISLPIHFWRTRRTFVGTLLGLGWTLALLGLDWLITEGVDALPEPALGPTLGLVLAGFAGALVYRGLTRYARARS